MTFGVDMLKKLYAMNNNNNEQGNNMACEFVVENSEAERKPEQAFLSNYNENSIIHR